MATYRLWPATSGPSLEADSQTYTLGVEFYVTQACNLNAFFFWLPTSGDTAARDFRLYEVDSASAGTPVTGTDKTSGTLTANAWNRVDLDEPVELVADQRYRACVLYDSTNFHYGATGGYWDSGAGASGITNGPLTAPEAAEATGTDQGQFNAGSSMTFPADSFGSANYWIDVEVEDIAGVTLTPADALHAHTADAVTLTQKHVLVPADALHAHAADAVTLTQKHVLVPADALHAHAADQSALTVLGTLVPADALHAHAADAVTLTQKHVLVPASTLHAHGADQVTFADDAAGRRTDLWEWLWHMEREGVL